MKSTSGKFKKKNKKKEKKTCARCNRDVTNIRRYGKFYICFDCNYHLRYIPHDEETKQFFDECVRITAQARKISIQAAENVILGIPEPQTAREQAKQKQQWLSWRQRQGQSVDMMDVGRRYPGSFGG